MLSTELLLRAYCSGIFPMAVNDDGDLAWFAPDPRALIPLDERFHIPHGLRRRLKRHPFQITTDKDFQGVMQGCATAHGSTWISKEIIEAYMALHREGYAHSIEVWEGENLVGGLYGVHLGGAFFGESMFHRATDASKIALVWLVEHLRERGFSLLDTQWQTAHLETFGTYLVPKKEYLRLLRKALGGECRF